LNTLTGYVGSFQIAGMSKVQFVLGHTKYLAESKEVAQAFVDYWQPNFTRISPLKTNWKIKGIERAPGWVPIPIDMENKIEYGKS